jgi:hypothetical protein
MRFAASAFAKPFIIRKPSLATERSARIMGSSAQSQPKAVLAKIFRRRLNDKVNQRPHL